MRKATTNEVLTFIGSNTPNASQLIGWATACNLTVKELAQIIQGLIKSKRVKQNVTGQRELTYTVYEITKQ